MITQPQKSKSLLELGKESVIVTLLINSEANLLICSRTFINLKHIQKLETMYEFDVSIRFHT